MYVIACVLLSVLDSVFAVESAMSSVSGRHIAWYELLFQVKFLPEVLIGVFMLLYCGNIYLGKRANDEIALAFGNAFCEDEGLLERNFSQVGPRIGDTDDVILRESMNKYSIYATGRRFCKGFSATLDLKHRQDLMFLASYLINPCDDLLDIEIPMNESNMQPMVVLIAPHKLAKQMAKNLPDVKSFAQATSVGKDRLSSFPTDKLTVYSETQALFYDLMTERVMELLFSRTAFQDASKYFRYLHFSTENPEGSARQSLKFSFLLPPKEQLQDLLKCLTAVLYFIDVSKRPGFMLSHACHNTVALPAVMLHTSRNTFACAQVYCVSILPALRVILR